MEFSDVASVAYSPLNVLLCKIDQLENPRHLAESKVKKVASRALGCIALIPVSVAAVVWRLGLTAVLIPGALVKLILGEIPLNEGKLGNQFSKAFTASHALHSLYRAAVMIPIGVLGAPIVLISPNALLALYRELELFKMPATDKPEKQAEPESSERELQTNLEQEEPVPEESAVIDRSQEVAELTGELQEKQTAFADALKEVDDSRKKLEQAEIDTADVEKEVSVLQQQLADKEERLVQEQENGARLEEEISGLQDRLAGKEEELTAMREAKRQLEGRIGEWETMVHMLEEGLEERKQNVDSLKNQLTEKEEEIAEAWESAIKIERLRAKADQLNQTLENKETEQRGSLNDGSDPRKAVALFKEVERLKGELKLKELKIAILKKEQRLEHIAKARAQALEDEGESVEFYNSQTTQLKQELQEKEAELQKAQNRKEEGRYPQYATPAAAKKTSRLPSQSQPANLDRIEEGSPYKPPGS